MPIHCQLKLRNLTEAEFDDRDSVVMGCAYAAQNALGRLCEERVYENDLARRLRAEGFRSVHTQVPITVSHDGFAKEYRLDLVVDEAVYELKTVNAMLAQHEAQALHYAMLCDINHVKLLNFRSERVEGQLKFNVCLDPNRRNITWQTRDWSVLSSACADLKQVLRELIKDWGACLEVKLYEEALVHLLGGEAKCVRRIPIVVAGVELGTHPVVAHADDVCFLITAFTSSIEAQRIHIQRLLALTRLRAVQWINLNHTNIELRTVTKG